MPVVPSYEQLAREACKASIMVEGLTGKGKSGLALMLGFGLAGGFKPNANAEDVWKKVYTTDTENRSLNLFVGIPASFGGKYGRPFGAQLTSTDGYQPSNYLFLRDAAIKRGAEVWIGDSVTHMWTAKGGVLDIVNDIKLRNAKMDNYRVWGDPKVSAEKQNLIDVIRDARCHVITTVRVKEKFEMQYNDAKKGNDVVSIGEQQLQQEGLKYEPDLVLHMIAPGSNKNGEVKHPVAKVIKSRYAIFTEGDEYEFTPELCEQLRSYLADGVDPDTLLAKQHQDYVQAITEFLNANQSAVSIWNIIKADAGFADVKLMDIPLAKLKLLYTQITA